ncbi:glycoside hydrolase family 65 protein [Clostridium psychrophilum]|uniref:glycoside hydrolase family 65 protein n=1 Tax=Clostridium psychrophilum TaxID=132926 RepID=UPI001C0E0A33|nr:glycosyl hydrolase family 65 protein [Clostridium psychrophilum]MBU3180184.1 glycoside hydrolase family 65 protein [Clostridium psychrophilum]
MKLWSVEQKKYTSIDNKKYETLFTLANGYRGLRGQLEFTKLGQKGNFIAGIFDKSSAQVTEIVNLQDPILLNIYIDDEIIDMEQCKVLAFNRRLSMLEGVLYTAIELETRKGKIINLKCERFVSRNNVHRWAAKYEIVPVNFTGKVFFESVIDGTVTNSSQDPMNLAKHFNVDEIFDVKPGIGLKSSTFDKKISAVETTRLLADNDFGNIFKSRKYNMLAEKAREVYSSILTQGELYTVYKLGVSFTSRDKIKNITEESKKELDAFTVDGYEEEKEAHKAVWQSIWNDIDIEIHGDDEAQVGIRFNLYQLASSAYEGDEKISIAAKGLHGEGYKGHIFWDTETFMLPFFIYTRPKVAKALLMYRYNTLQGARKNAEISGFKGARYPWESADEGLEVTPKWGFDYDGKPVRIWTGDEEFHINSDITFAIFEYYRATGDKDFLINYGLEILLDTTKFWQSRVEYNKKEDRYEINGVIGPDEFHEHVDNNVFTNFLAKWSIKKALDLVQWIKKEDALVLKKLCNKLSLNELDFKAWETIEKKMYIPTSKDGKLIEQFEGYFNMPSIEITKFDENGMPEWPDFKGLKIAETQLIKQADVVQLMIMLGEEFSDNVKKENYKYYEKRTMHKSSLSPSMYSIMGITVGDTHNAYKYFMKTVLTDLKDNQGNTDFGIHSASNGGSWQTAIMGFGGLSVDKDEVLNLKPWIPKHWDEMNFNINWRKTRIYVSIRQDKIVVKATNSSKVKIYNDEYNLKKDEEITVTR